LPSPCDACPGLSHDLAAARPPRRPRIMEKHEKQSGFMKALKCRECGREYPLAAIHVCEYDFGPLEVAYDYERIKQSMTRAAIESRPKSMWRFRELLPVAGDPTVGWRWEARR